MVRRNSTARSLIPKTKSAQEISSTINAPSSSVEYHDVNYGLSASAFRAAHGQLVARHACHAMPCPNGSGDILLSPIARHRDATDLYQLFLLPLPSPHALYHPEPTLTSFDKAGYLSLQRPPCLTWRPFPLFPQKWRVASAEGRRWSVRVKRRTCNGKSRAWKEKRKPGNKSTVGRAHQTGLAAWGCHPPVRLPAGKRPD
jgi:hypothetical protein